MSKLQILDLVFDDVFQGTQALDNIRVIMDTLESNSSKKVFFNEKDYEKMFMLGLLLHKIIVDHDSYRGETVQFNQETIKASIKQYNLPSDVADYIVRMCML